LSAIRTVCRSRRLLAWASVMVMWACGGGRVTATGSDASASAAGDERAGETADAAGPGSGDGQSGSSTDGGLAMAPICPDTEPTEGAPCLPTLDCSYGQSVRPDCRHRWNCGASSPGGTGAWHAVSLTCPEAPVGYCPPQQPTASTCTPMTNPNERADCEYPGNVFCQCACPYTPQNPGCASTEQWVCYGPPTTPGCPAVVPNLGTACSVQGTQCAYGDPCDVGGLAVYCRAGIWEVGQAACAG
jgi:hypothetical protein